ncbi:4Fe-4S dicluster domain-containing protein [Chloroflexota bacterium]
MAEKKTVEKKVDKPAFLDKNPMDMTDEELYKALAWKMKRRAEDEDGYYGKSKYLPLIFEKMLRGREDAVILLNLPGWPADIAPKVNMTEDEVESRIQVLGEKCIAFKTSKGWFLPRSMVGQLHDAGLCVPKYDEEYGEEFFLLWEAFCNLEYFLYPSPMIGEEKPDTKKFTRILPDRRTLAKDLELAPWEDLKVILDILDEESKLGFFPCSCLRAMPDDPNADDYWKCITWGRGYEYWSGKEGSLHTLSSDEMMAEIDRMHGKGMATIAPNYKGFASAPGVQMFCNCHADHCDVLRPAILHGYEPQTRVSPSRYLMTVKDTENCKSCQKCVEQCMWGAAQLKYIPDGKWTTRGKWKAWVDTDKCVGCGNCALVCPINNRELRLKRDPAHVPDEKPETGGG